jgi:pyruvate,orthophosphate dikinase
MSWSDEFRKIGVRTNADTPDDARVAVKFGAAGIGLCRTEHMFFDKDRIIAVREMIFANTVNERQIALDKIYPFQRSDFEGLFTVLNGLPVNIRLLDPPLHEFLPHTQEDKEKLAQALHLDIKAIEIRGEQLHEFNPMLGHRGCRLGVTFPEIYRMQVRAIIEAALNCSEKGINVIPEIMIPLVAVLGELTILKEEAVAEIDKVFKARGKKIKYKIGTMIELPRAAIMASTFAPHAEFFSFGTNDLTQTTFGLSRDDAGKFLPEYVTKGLMPSDPFVSIDQDGVGFLMKHAISEGRKTNPNMHFGICGEHGGEPKSIEFCHNIGLDYVSCSPYRVPIARLAAAQAAIKNRL